MFCILTSCPYNYYYSNCALETISSETQVEAKNGGLVVMVSAAVMVMLEVVVVGGGCKGAGLIQAFGIELP